MYSFCLIFILKNGRRSNEPLPVPNYFLRLQIETILKLIASTLIVTIKITSLSIKKEL